MQKDDTQSQLEWQLKPDLQKQGQTSKINGINHKGDTETFAVITERPLTLFLNDMELITNMSIGDYPEYLAVGYLFNQHIISDKAQIAAIDHDDDLGVVVVRTHEKLDFQKTQSRKIRTSGCAQGTIFDNIIDEIKGRVIENDGKIYQSWLLDLQKKINLQPSLYLQAGAVHGCVLCKENQPLIYMEDVGRHNAIDKIAGYMLMHDIEPHDKIFYTTGRLTSEMVIKTIMMNIPILVSRSGFTDWGVSLARDAGLTLIGRMRGERFMLLSGEQRMVWDAKTAKD
ncbi:MAG: formate dehydrogenase accessory sulfurtransferase FdhD [Alphaproteobacteria bacterium]|nr:formate dehydrogenase accessory sulfurtransferase FdhD [Alphaproteobacteria bacterium]